ncbi:EPM2A-interacting protein 1-like [Watersipora subatra]|uniref:EPM2A-interacting protein 1-like n=1 Tax=Watersipora subatra TaxID=2589382 RepID=UPI00355B8170
MEAQIKKFVYFTIALDESTDLSDTSQLAIIIRGVGYEFNVTADFLTMSSLHGTTTGKDVYESLLKELAEFSLPLEKMSGICTDGAPAMRQQNGHCVELNSEQYANIVSDLSAEFARRFFQFAETEKKIKIFFDPFSVNPSSLAAELQMELNDLQANKRLKQRHLNHELIEFYHHFFPAGTYQALHKHALRMVSLFSSTYLCEQFFSRMKQTKSTYRTGLTDEHLAQQLRISFSDIKPDLDRIVQEKQCQVAH